MCDEKMRMRSGRIEIGLFIGFMTHYIRAIVLNAYGCAVSGREHYDIIIDLTC